MISGLGGDNDHGLYVSRSRGYLRRRSRVRLVLRAVAALAAVGLVLLSTTCGMLGYAHGVLH